METDWNKRHHEPRGWDAEYEPCVIEGEPPDCFDGPLKYPFLRWLIEIIGASFCDFAERELRDKLKSPEWKKEYLQSNYYVNKNWENPEMVELKHWPLMLDKAKLPESAYCSQLRGDPTLTPRRTILGYADNLRNAVFDRTFIEMHVLRDILLIPQILRDKERADLIEMVWKVVIEEPGVEAQTRADILKMLNFKQKPCTTFHQAHSRVLALLEEGCFLFAKRRDPNVLKHRDWETAADVEVRSWRNVWSYETPPIQIPDSPAGQVTLAGQKITPHRLCTAIFEHAVELRNIVAHPSVLDQDDLCWYSLAAMLLLILFEERTLALEIEILVEGFNTKQSRDKVLLRLHEYYNENELTVDQSQEHKRCQAVHSLYRNLGVSRREEIREVPKPLKPDGSETEHATSESAPQRELGLHALASTSSPVVEPNLTDALELGTIDAHMEHTDSVPTTPLSSYDICKLAIKKYIISDSMHDGLRLYLVDRQTECRDTTDLVQFADGCLNGS